MTGAGGLLSIVLAQPSSPWVPFAYKNARPRPTPLAPSARALTWTKQFSEVIKRVRTCTYDIGPMLDTAVYVDFHLVEEVGLLLTDFIEDVDGCRGADSKSLGTASASCGGTYKFSCRPPWFDYR